MLERFTITNFKALEYADLSFGRITALVGPNGTGKSSVLQALTLLKQSRGRTGLEVSGRLLNLGGFEDVVCRHEVERVISLLLQAGTSELKLPGLGAQRGEVTYEARFDRGGLLSHQLILRGALAVEGEWNRSAAQKLVPDKIEYLPHMSVSLKTSNTVGEPVQITGWNAQAGEAISETTRVSLGNYLGAASWLLSRVYLVPPVRGLDAPAYPLQAESTDDFFGTGGPAEQASRVLSTIAYRRELEDAISDFSVRALGARIRVRLIPDKMVSAEAYDGWQANLVNEGFGANQLIVLLAQLVVAPEDSLIGVEEPEVHLHPKAQAALADIFTELVTREPKQVVLTTHSEHVLMGLLTEVARGRLKPEDLRVYYFEKDGTGIARPELLEVDKHGRLRGGLKGFFEANVDELESYLGVLSKRRGG